MNLIRVLLVDDHRLFRDGVRALLSAYADIEVVGEANDSREALELVETVACDLIIIDITLPGSNGLALLRELKRLKIDQPTLILTMHQQADMVADAFSAGATGYALKHQSESELVEAVRMTARGATYLAPQLPQELAPEAGASPPGAPGRSVLALLSSREREIFDLIVRGSTNAQIAKLLFISIKTVETHR